MQRISIVKYNYSLTLPRCQQFSQHLQMHKKLSQSQPQTVCMQTAASKFTRHLQSDQRYSGSWHLISVVYFRKRAIHKLQKYLEDFKPCYCVYCAHFLAEMLDLWNVNWKVIVNGGVFHDAFLCPMSIYMNFHLTCGRRGGRRRSTGRRRRREAEED